jgi:hypothetical protein
MKRNLIFAALLSIATAASAESVTFGNATPQPGITQWDDDATYAMSVTTNAGGKSASASRNVTRSKTCRLLQLDPAGRMDAVEVAYDGASNASVAGKRYRVTPQSVTYADGSAAPAAEATFVRSDNASFSQFRALKRIFGGGTFAVGDSFTPNRNDAEELLNVAAGTRLRSIALTLRSVSDGIATFDISMTLESNPKQKKSSKAAGGEMTMTLDGTLKMTVATAWPLQLDVDGPLHGNTKKANGSHAGDASGTASIRIDYGF